MIHCLMTRYYVAAMAVIGGEQFICAYCMQGLSAYIIKFDNIERSNQGHLIFSWLFFINEACYD